MRNGEQRLTRTQHSLRLRLLASVPGKVIKKTRTHPQLRAKPLTQEEAEVELAAGEAIEFRVVSLPGVELTDTRKDVTGRSRGTKSNSL